MSHLHAKRFDILDNYIMEEATPASNMAFALWLCSCEHSCALRFVDSLHIASLCPQGEKRATYPEVSLYFIFCL